MRSWGVLLCLLPLCLYGQGNFASIEGRIIDSSQRPVSGARIEVRAKATGAVRTTLTNEAGLFEVPSLPPAEYLVAATAEGFSPINRDITVEVGQHMTVDLTLSVTSRRETIAVVATADTLKTQDVSLGEVVETKAVRELPLNGRMLIDLALTVPGAHIGHGAQTGDMNPLYWRPGQRSAITIGGNRPNANYFPARWRHQHRSDLQHAELQPVARCRAGVSGADRAATRRKWAARAAGRSTSSPAQGTEQFHGTAYEYLRNGALDARTWNEMPGTNASACRTISAGRSAVR